MRASISAGLLILATTASLGGIEPQPAPPISGIQTADMDLAVRPQDDLFAYANGTWLRNVPIPPDRDSYGIQSLLQEQSLKEQRGLLEAADPAPDQNARKVRDLYASFMDTTRIERLGATPLQPELRRIAAIGNTRDLATAMAHLDRIGVNTPIGTYVDPDAKHPDRYAFWLYESGLGLPDRDYYLSDSAKFAEVRAKYQAHIARMLRLIGAAKADSEAAEIVRLEIALAKLHWPTVDSRDPQKTYNPQTPRQIEQMAPQMDWKSYFQAQALPAHLPVIIVREPSFFRELSALLTRTPLASWKAYLRFRLLAASAPYLPKAYADEYFAFDEGVLHGTPEIPARWKRGCALADRLMGDALGKLYAAKYFPPASKARTQEMVRNLLKAYAASIQSLAWMSPATKQEALAKLDAIDVKIGYPDRWRSYDGLTLSPADLLANVFRAEAFETARKRALLAGPVDRSEWQMTAPTVDAYYSAATNEIAFPAGVLQPPLFDPRADDAYNYGSTGATIGHEISHGFDNRGSQYDAHGNLRDWWTPEDHAKYAAETKKLVSEFDAFEPVPGFHVNGALTLSENIADLAGLEIAYQAYIASLHEQTAPVIDGLTGAQRFFIGYAQSYLGKQRTSLLIARIKSNPHAPEQYRVNGIVVNVQSFYDAFHVTPGDKMYILPSARAVLWSKD